MLISESIPLLQTKLHPPKVAHGPILRPPLFELLDAGENNVLTLVSAPPGYGKMADASLWAKNFDQDSNRASYRFFVPHLTLVKILLAEDTPASLKEATGLIAQLEEIYLKIHNNRVLIQVLVLKALCLQKADDTDTALNALHQAIQLAQPGGIIRPFIGASPD